VQALAAICVLSHQSGKTKNGLAEQEQRAFRGLLEILRPSSLGLRRSCLAHLSCLGFDDDLGRGVFNTEGTATEVIDERIVVQGRYFLLLRFYDLPRNPETQEAGGNVVDRRADLIYQVHQVRRAAHRSGNLTQTNERLTERAEHRSVSVQEAQSQDSDQHCVLLCGP